MAVPTASDAAYTALKEGCALIEPAADGKLALTGPQAAECLAGQVTNDIVALAPGSGCYAALLTNKGKMLADLRVLRLPEPTDELLLITERATLQTLFDTLRRALIGWDAELHKRTLQRARFVLGGPDARAIAGADAAGLPTEEHASRAAQIASRDVLLVATDGGVEVYCDADDHDAVRDALLGAGATPVDEQTAEIARVERGRPRYGLELDDAVIPQEAGLNERAVSFTKGCYVGQETVARLFYKGKPNRTLRGLRLSAAAQTGDVLRLGEREVGRLASVADSPELGLIALAIVRREAGEGDTLGVGDGDVTATIVALPFAAG